MAHLETVRNIYAAFGRGDVPAILDCLSDSVEWEYGITSTDVPWLQPRRGRSAVAGFFQSLAAIDIQRFEPKRFLADHDLVVVLFDLEGTVKATGRRIVEEDEAHIWYFNAQGQVTKFRHRVDTHQHVSAYKSSSAAAV